MTSATSTVSRLVLRSPVKEGDPLILAPADYCCRVARGVDRYLSDASDAERLVHVLSHTEARVTRELEKVLAQENCTVERWRALALLADGGPHAMTELASFALVSAPSLTRLVDRLVADNLAYRLPDPRDRRRVLVHITDRGRDCYRRACRRIARDGDAIVSAVDWSGLALVTELVAQTSGR